jgi:hypothetical protein
MGAAGQLVRLGLLRDHQTIMKLLLLIVVAAVASCAAPGAPARPTAVTEAASWDYPDWL